MVLLLVVVVLAGFLGSRLPGGFLPEEDQGYFYLNVQLPTAASLERTDDVAQKIEGILKETPGVADVQHNCWLQPLERCKHEL